mmetsp:Transcript_93044/g.240881  ORF Transcript_93044/g.240881 Transcript_93044/m.240881 type:complete len:296 (-) Transcript_93044:451-1338(-)
MSKSNSFFLSSASSSLASQKAFLSSSVPCSFPSSATISSIMLSTLSKLTFFPRRAKATRSKRVSWPCPRWAARRTLKACCRTSLPRIFICSNDGLGSVFLNKSKASSSFRSLMVSAIANNSSARVFCTTSNSSFFVAQFFSKSARNFLSSSYEAEVSSKSSRKVSISTPTFPRRAVFPSMDLEFAAISFSLAATSCSYVAFAAFSSAVRSAKSFSIVSFICLRMPTISPLRGTYPVCSPWPWERKDAMMSLSALLNSMSMVKRRSTPALLDCRKLPYIPVEIAAIAFPKALMFVS